MFTKPFQKAAFRNEGGHVGTNQAPGWGDVNTNTALGTGCGFPYLTLGKSKTVSTVEDNSIVSEGFQDIPRAVTHMVEQSLTLVNKFDGLDPLLYWSFGLEDEVLSVVCYVCNTPTTEPTEGAQYTDSDSNVLTFLRKEILASTIYYVFQQTGVVSSATGTLTFVSGTGSDLTFLSHSTIMYEKIFIIDPRERHLVAPNTDERLSGYTSGDLKCRFATIGVNTDTSTDYRFQNAICKKFSISSSAAALSEIAVDFLAYERSIGDYSSSTWTFPGTLADSDSNIVHHNFAVYINEVEVGATSFNLGFDIPLQVIQDTVSGLHISEPLLEGKYTFTSEITLSRYSSLTWQTLVDSWSEVTARVVAWSGYYLQEFFINNAIITNADPDDDNVAKQVIKLSPGDSSVNNLPNQGSSIDEYSPIMCRVRNTTSTNYMLV